VNVSLDIDVLSKPDRWRIASAQARSALLRA
jgi:hypothetical protein